MSQAFEQSGGFNAETGKLPRDFFLSQIAAVHAYAARSDAERRHGPYAGEQYFVHNAPEVHSPPTSSLWLKPKPQQEPMHNAREIHLFTPVEGIYWENGMPLFTFAQITSSQAQKFMFGIASDGFRAYRKGEKPAVVLTVNEENRPVLAFEAVKVSEADDSGQLSLIEHPPEIWEQTEEYGLSVVSALSSCLPYYRLFSQVKPIIEAK